MNKKWDNLGDLQRALREKQSDTAGVSPAERQSKSTIGSDTPKWQRELYESAARTLTPDKRALLNKLSSIPGVDRKQAEKLFKPDNRAEISTTMEAVLRHVKSSELDPGDLFTLAGILDDRYAGDNKKSTEELFDELADYMMK